MCTLPASWQWQSSFSAAAQRHQIIITSSPTMSPWMTQSERQGAQSCQAGTSVQAAFLLCQHLHTWTAAIVFSAPQHRQLQMFTCLFPALVGCRPQHASPLATLAPPNTLLSDRDIGIRFHPTRGAMSLGKSKGGLPPDSCCEEEDACLKDMRRVITEYHDNSR